VGLVDEIDNTFLVFVFFFASNLFSTGVLRVFAGLQRSFEVGLVSCAGSVLTMVLIWVATRVHAGIPVLFAVTFGVQALIGIVLLALLRRRQLIDCSGGLLQVISSGREYLGAGSLFLLLQIGAMIGWGADTLIISTSLGVAQVAIFNVTQRLFFFVNQPLSILNAPLWVTYAEANHKGDKNFLRSTLKRALVATFILALLGAVFLCWAGQFLIEHWTQGVIAVPMGLLLAYGAWTVVESTANAFSMFMNGCSLLRPQVWGVLTLVGVALPLKWWLINQFGLQVMMIGFTLFFVANLIFWYGWVYKSQIRAYLQ
jgi:O-antigen/teichoic acid export membrane protein